MHARCFFFDELHFKPVLFDDELRIVVAQQPLYSARFFETTGDMSEKFRREADIKHAHVGERVETLGFKCITMQKGDVFEEYEDFSTEVVAASSR